MAKKNNDTAIEMQTFTNPGAGFNSDMSFVHSEMSMSMSISNKTPTTTFNPIKIMFNMETKEFLHLVGFHLILYVFLGIFFLILIEIYLGIKYPSGS